MRKCQKRFIRYARRHSNVVEHSTHNPKIEGLIPVAGTVMRKCQKYKIFEEETKKKVNNVEVKAELVIKATGRSQKGPEILLFRP